MNQEPMPSESQRKPVLEIIQQIKDGKLDPTTLDKEERQSCLSTMLAEGLNAPTLAQILRVSDKTIRRDIKEIRMRNGFTPNVEFVKETAGEILTYARISRDHLMRLARTKESSVMERAQAEMYANQVFLSAVSKLQSMGYLPQQAQAIIGDIFLHNVPSTDELQKEILELDKILDVGSNAKGQVNQLKNFVDDMKTKEGDDQNGNSQDKSNE